MRVREIKKEDVKVGMRVVNNAYNINTHDIGRLNRLSVRVASLGVHPSREDIVFYESGGWDTVDDLLSFNWLIEEEKPTGIPTFDGDLPQGTKLDSGKVKPSLLLDDMPLAINEILKVIQFGAKKYSEGNWLKVPNGIDRYRNAADRHRLAINELDDESGMMHLAHEATSVLMLLELKLKEQQNAE